MNTKNQTENNQPIVSIMGHVDHGKSTLLDYIRKSNVVAGEAGGITQHISAYEVDHQGHKITFLDTPGHSAFSNMRIRGALASDIAVLIVSAEDGVKAQTIETFEAIQNSKIPFIVAINKIDKPGANVERTKNTLLEHGIYLEGMGGDVPFVLISAKTGEGVPELLDIIVFLTEFNGIKHSLTVPANGIVLESKRDPKRGITATLLVREGILKSGDFIVAGDAIVKAIIMENFLNNPIKDAPASCPVNIAGFSIMPKAGTTFETYKTKKEVELISKTNTEITNEENKNLVSIPKSSFCVPIIIKADVVGSLEAVEQEIIKLNNEEYGFNIISKSVGTINENDLKTAIAGNDVIILGLHTGIERNAEYLRDQTNTTVMLFDIIYKLTEWLSLEIEKRRPRKVVETNTGTIHVLKYFSATKERQVVGGKIEFGFVKSGANIKILRRGNMIGTGKIIELQKNKSKSKEVFENDECGILVEANITIAEGDKLEAITKETI